MAVCQAGERFGLLRLDMSLRNRDGSLRVLSWQRPNASESSSEAIRFDVPIRQRRAGGPLRMIVHVHVGDSMELAGCRATCFGRLVDKHNIAALAASPPAGVGDASSAETVGVEGTARPWIQTQSGGSPD